MATYLNLDGYYQCPDCRATVQGYELQRYGNSRIPYVCPGCGCTQNISEVIAQLSQEDKEANDVE